MAFQEKGASADGRLWFLQVAELLHYFWGNNPHARRVRQRIDEPDVGLFEEKFHRIAVDDLDSVYRVQDVAIGVPRFSQKAVIGEFDILRHQLAAVEGGLIVPFNALAQVEHIRGVVQLLPAFGQIGLHDKGPWRHISPDLMSYQFVVDEAQRGMRLEADRQMWIEVHRLIPAHTQEPTAPRLPRFGPTRSGGLSKGESG